MNKLKLRNSHTTHSMGHDSTTNPTKQKSLHPVPTHSTYREQKHYREKIKTSARPSRFIPKNTSIEMLLICRWFSGAHIKYTFGRYCKRKIDHKCWADVVCLRPLPWKFATNRSIRLSTATPMPNKLKSATNNDADKLICTQRSLLDAYATVGPHQPGPSEQFPWRKKIPLPYPFTQN